MKRPRYKRPRYNTSADECRARGFKPGDRLVGDEGYGPTVIELTAIGERLILAKRITHNGIPVAYDESLWTLEFRDWQRVETEAKSG